MTELAFGELDCMTKSFWSVVSMFGTVQNSPWSLEMLLAKTESSYIAYIGNVYMCPWKMTMLKLCFLTYVKKGKSNEMLKYSSKGIRKVQKSNG